MQDTKPGDGHSAAQVEHRSHSAGNLKGIAAMVAATALFCCGDAFMKLVSGALPTGETIFVRSFCSAIILTVAAVATGAIGSVRQAFVPIMGWRCAGDAGSSIFFQAALARMPFADIMGVLQMTPLCLTAASGLFLGERVGWRRWTAVAIGLGGAMLIIKPGSTTFNVWAILVVLSVLGATLRDVSTRRLDRTLSPLVILMLSQFAVAMTGLACWSFQEWAVPSPAECLRLVLASVFSLVGHLCVIHSLRSGEVSAVAPFRYAGMVWAIVLGLAIWNELPDAMSLVGITILTSAGLYTFYREQRLRRASLR